jgi:hypothetical protein
MLSTRKAVAVSALLAMTAAGVALAETTAGDHQMGLDHIQHAMPAASTRWGRTTCGR